MVNVFEELQWRGLVYDYTEGVAELLTKEKVTLYNGFDPTASSLHVGHLVPVMALARLQRFGHTPIAVVGGGTGMIGDPSGRSAERVLLSPEMIESNIAGIRPQLERVLDFEIKSNPAVIVNNLDWLGKLSMIEYLRDVGKEFTVNQMLGKDSVKNRIDREAGLSYTEFSYMLLQAYDFLHLNQHYGCVLQTGGSDQWGNITAGTTLIRRIRQTPAYGLVYPLITKSDGSKFGKTADGSIWLDPALTSPYQFYQFWFNTADDDVLNYLRYFTWLRESEVADLAESLSERPHEREAQQALARELTAMIHGETAVEKAEQASQVLFGGSLDGISAEDIRAIFVDVPTSEITSAQLEGDGMPLVDLLVQTKLAQSKGDARRAIQGGAINLNNQRISESSRNVSSADSISENLLLLRKGRKEYHLVVILR